MYFGLSLQMKIPFGAQQMYTQQINCIAISDMFHLIKTYII